MKSNGKSTKQKSKPAKTPTTSKGARPTPKNKGGEAPGPDERRPEVKADEIYGDTKIPQRGGKF